VPQFAIGEGARARTRISDPAKLREWKIQRYETLEGEREKNIYKKSPEIQMPCL